MPTFTRFFIPALAGSLLAGSAPADNQPPIVISAGRTETLAIDTPASVTVLDDVETRSGAVRSLAELLPGRAGIHLRDPYGDGAYGVLDMRGFGATAGSNVLLLRDGLRLNNSSDIAAPDLNAIELGQIERVEIIQGSAGVLFGDQAVGGVVNIISRPPTARTLTATAGAGSYDAYALNLAAADRVYGGAALGLDAGRSETENYRDRNGAQRSALGLRLELPYDAGRAFLEQNYRRDDLHLPGSLFRSELALDRRQSAEAYQGDFSDTQTWLGRGGIRHALSESWTLEGELTYRDNDRRFQTSFRSFPGSTATQARRVWALNPRLVGLVDLGSRNLRLTLGADLETTDYRLRTAFGPQATEQQVYGLYGQASVGMAPGWNLTAGLRLAGVTNDIRNADQHLKPDDEVSAAAAGLTFDASPALRLFLRWDQSFRFAKVDEHTNTVTGQSAGLQTQTGNTYELGAHLRWRQLDLRAQIYRLDLNDEIGFDSSSFFNVNLPTTRRRGATLELDWTIARDWHLAGSYGYVDSETSAGPFAGNDLPLVPRHTGRLSLDWAAATGAGAYAEVLMVGDQTLGGDFANAFPKLDGYTVVNLAARYRYGNWLFSARLNNLLDERYSGTGAVGYDADFNLRDAYFPAPERNFWLSARYAFGD
jgi:iron complex outermembrane receptor protein